MERSTEPANGFDRALSELSEALATRKVEPICTSYLALRRLARGIRAGELLDRVGQAAGEDARAVIVSAFSHRRCFMCENGTDPCNACEGTGMADGAPCRLCDGLGVEACTFCLGSGWSDRNETPAEIRPAVLKRQIAHVEKETVRLARTGRKVWASARRLPPGRRAELTAWLLRLQARLADLAASVADNGNEKVARYGVLAAQIGKLLERLRAKRPHEVELEEEL